jgi:hypothetical protein
VRTEPSRPGPRGWRHDLVRAAPPPRRWSRSSGPSRGRERFASDSHALLAAEILAGRRVGIYIEQGAPLLIFDPETRELLRTRPNPLTHEDAVRLQSARPAGPVPRPSTEPVTVQRRVASNGVIMVAGQKVALGRVHAGRTVTVHVSETTLAIELPDAETRVVRRTTEQAVRSIKGQRPRTADTSVS